MAASLYLETLANKWLPTRWSLPEAVVDLTGRTVVITGSNTGLGLEAAKKFYAMNPERLILAVRSLSKGNNAKRVLEGDSTTTTGVGGSRPQVDVWEIDMSSFESVKAFANRCKNELKRIDVFLANAGVNTAPWALTTDGWETNLQTNVIATFLLATLIAPILIDTAKLPPPKPGVNLKPHLVIVVSDMHEVAPLQARNQENIFAALNSEKQYDQESRYPDTKLLAVLLTRQLATLPQLQRDASGIVICSLNPGFCRSEVLREFNPIVRAIIYGMFARSTEDGGKKLVWASLTNDIPQGSYVSSSKVARSSPFVRSKEGEQVQKKVWNELGEILAPVAPEVAHYWVSP
ncbi:hypothetical protein FRC17_007388 [Serendipita sp. 399]|nr:hypothetical protein FRC17_007388 [Serendipita sp. 399]